MQKIKLGWLLQTYLETRPQGFLLYISHQLPLFTLFKLPRHVTPQRHWLKLPRARQGDGGTDEQPVAASAQDMVVISNSKESETAVKRARDKCSATYSSSVWDWFLPPSPLGKGKYSGSWRLRRCCTLWARLPRDCFEILWARLPCNCFEILWVGQQSLCLQCKTAPKGILNGRLSHLSADDLLRLFLSVHKKLNSLKSLAGE